MNVRLADLRNKEVINVNDGTRLGYVCDLEVNLEQARVLSLVIDGRPRLFGILGREEDVVIPWDMVQTIGDDTILVHYAAPEPKEKSPSALGKFFHS